MKPGSSTPAPNNVCQKCKKHYAEHWTTDGRDMWCDYDIGNTNVFTPAPAPEVAATSDNELIDAFMGYPVYARSRKYDTSWDWLMPVVEKISELECVYSIDYHVHMVTIFSDETFQKHGEGINIVYQVVIDFLKWYNTQTPKS